MAKRALKSAYIALCLVFCWMMSCYKLLND
ncbi:Uncharacterised protein [Vibrio cholerae]|nr:Uncharacterised protein [Vibrio cholerae]